jgi:dGTP triphosphohydrolase
VVSWADRIAYVCHDFEDAVAAGIVSIEMLPPEVREHCGVQRSQQLGAFIHAMIDAASTTGRVGMTTRHAEALASFRQFNYEYVYLRPGVAGAGTRRRRHAARARRALRRPTEPAPGRARSRRRRPDALRAAVAGSAG